MLGAEAAAGQRDGAGLELLLGEVEAEGRREAVLVRGEGEHEGGRRRP